MSGNGYQFDISVVGADVAAADLAKVSAAEDAVAKNSTDAAAGVESLELALRDVQRGSQAAGQSLSYFGANAKGTASAISQLEQNHRRTVATTSMLAKGYGDASTSARGGAAAVETWGHAVQAAAPNTSLLGRAAEGLSKGLGLVMRAAYILPGLGIAGIIGGAISGVAALWDAIAGDDGQAANRQLEYQIALSREHADYLHKQAEAARELGIALTEAGRAFAASGLGVTGSSLSGAATIAGVSAQMELNQIKEQRKNVDARAAELVKLRDEVKAERMALVATGQGAAAAWRNTMPAPQTLADVATLGALRLKLERLEREGAEVRAEYNRLRDREVDIRRELRLATGGDITTGDKKSREKQEALYDPLAPLGNRALPDLRAENTSEALRRGLLAHPDPGDSNIPGGRSIAAGEPVSNIPKLLGSGDAYARFANQGSEAFKSFAASAMDMSSTVVGAIGAVTGAFGTMATNLILSGKAGAKGVWESVGNSLAGFSAQAFSFGFLLEGIAGALLLAGPAASFLGFSAGGLAAGGLAAMGTGAALGVAARALGAKPIGVPGASGGKGGAGASAPDIGAGSSGFGVPAGGQPALELHVYMGGDEVHDVMYRASVRRAMAGSMTLPRLAPA